MSQATTAESSADGEPVESAATSAPVDAILRVHPRLRHDVVFADTGLGAFVRNTETGFLIRGKSAYRWLAALVPYLTGELTVGDLCDGLPEQRRDVVTAMVRTLLDRGFARDTPPFDSSALPTEVADRFRSQINFIGHYVDDAVNRFAAYRHARVLILGAGETSRAVAAGLLRNGSADVELRTPGPAGPAADEDTPDGPLRRSTGPVGDPAGLDLVVVCADEVGPAAIAEACAGLVAGGPAILPVMTVGRKVIIGPLTRPGAAPCWHCLMLRLHSNLDGRELADLWRGIALGGPGTALPSVPVAQMVGATAAFDVFRVLTGSMIGESAGAILVQDAETLESVRERLLPHPACAVCHGEGPPAAPGPTPLELATVDPAAVGEEELHERLQNLVREHGGIVAEFDDHGLDQAPLKVARCRSAARTLVAFDLQTVLQARRSLLLRAAALYVDELADLRTALAGAQVPADLRIEGSRLAIASGLPTSGECPHLPATDLASGLALWLPAAAVHPMSGLNSGAAYEPTSAGLGAGVTIAEADENGLLSALAYQGLRDAAAGAPVLAIGPGEVPSNETVTFLRRAAGPTVRLYRLPGAQPAVGVLAVTPDGWAVGAARDLTAAVVAALRGLVGQEQLRRQETAADTGDALLADFDPGTLRIDQGAATGASTDSQPGPIDLLAALAASGRRAVRVNTTTPDLRLIGVVTTVRVLLVAQAPPRRA